MGVRVGIDTGGTFTDLVAVDEESGRWFVSKVPSNPRDPVAAVSAALEAAAFDPADVSFVVVGTTIGINAVLTRSGARVLYLTTKGFEDIPFIQRISRKYHYDYTWRKPTPLVHRPDCIGVTERVDEEGNVIVPLDQEDLERALAKIPVDGERVALAVCYLFSYLEPAHELATREALRGRTDLSISLSHEVAPIWREYERGTTVIVDAYLKPLLEDYVEGLSVALAAQRVSSPCSLLKSNGGHALAAGAARAPLAPAPLRHRGRGDRRRPLRAPRRHGSRHRPRHGRDELRRLPRRRRRARLLGRLRDRVRLPGQRPRREHEDDGRRRRLDRLGRPRRLPPGRPAERGRRPGSGLLRPGRRGGDSHRCEPRPRPAQSGLLPRRAAAPRRRAEPRGTRAPRRAARPSRGRRGLRHGADREREHGERHPHRHRRAGDLPARVRARGDGRGRPDPRRRDRRRLRVPEPAQADGAGGEEAAREVWFPGHGFVETPVVRREAIPTGTRRDGPLVVEEMDSTIVVPPHWRLVSERGSVLELVRKEA